MIPITAAVFCLIQKEMILTVLLLKITLFFSMTWFINVLLLAQFNILAFKHIFQIYTLHRSMDFFSLHMHFGLKFFVFCIDDL